MLWNSIICIVSSVDDCIFSEIQRGKTASRFFSVIVKRAPPDHFVAEWGSLSAQVKARTA